ncbi:MAG: flagellar hook protein FlgE [Cupriavidus sp.]|jgi:flagellar hook protein FlgE|uniref:flagellar hook protein FlgE n=1 Tax=Cupriavidus pauculus TaxID=82633 RepID=UPI000781764B|nr:flagellar hook protein FlgE [Cupriavidus pauculus]MBU67051.1 flagellar hook protein FlgE [Cupriavidus sp.]KAB0599128.1 flagellar hook protein FlgE [Cupriavidus pauculus]MBY4731065.1 flagellar hook protein FlgE [Cupriavidus pauculus]MCM3607306.1 flagellar hook protein FlgE [Cupriavidus pauculus]UAL01937.1 flagellar hook protein FlgE [Cupriavidus pauculus]
MGFGQGVSGLNAAASNLDVIGNNIANANTVGFKQSTAQFADVYAGSKIGLGTRVNAVVQSFTNGNISTSGRSMDVAISNGNGFFRLTNTDGQVYYSRNGQFQRLDDGRLVNATGLQVTGYPPGSTAGGVAPQPITISNAQMPPKATTNIAAQFQLDSRSAVPANAFASNPATVPPTVPDSTMFSYSTAMTVYDSLGNKQQLTAYFGKTGTTNAGGGNDWNMNVTDAAGNILSTITISFNANGTMTGTTPANPTVTLPAANGAAAMTAAVNLTGSTQFGSDNDPKSIVQNGFASGALVGYAVQEDGTILGSYSNEQTLSLGQIAMASFGNVEGLKPQGDNVWSATGASGQELLGVAGGAMGTLKSNAVEESNVDLSGQLVNLIVAQRNYQANAQTIKAQDTVLQTLVNI